MSGVRGYVFGYEDGRSSAEISRRHREIVDRLFYGQRLVQVDQSYLDQLHQLVEKFRSDSDHNYDTADQFHGEALRRKEHALRLEAHAKALQTQNSALQSQLAETQAALAEEQADHETTQNEKRGLNLFRLIATWLIDAHIAGRSDRAAFVEMRDMAKVATDTIERGEIFWGYRDEPEEKEGLRALLEELLRP